MLVECIAADDVRHMERERLVAQGLPEGAVDRYVRSAGRRDMATHGFGLPQLCSGLHLT